MSSYLNVAIFELGLLSAYHLRSPSTTSLRHC